MAKEKVIRIPGGKYHEIKNYLREREDSFLGYAFGENKVDEIYYGGISLRSRRKSPSQKVFSKHEIVFNPEIGSRKLLNRLVTLVTRG